MVGSKRLDFAQWGLCVVRRKDHWIGQQQLCLLLPALPQTTSVMPRRASIFLDLSLVSVRSRTLLPIIGAGKLLLMGPICPMTYFCIAHKLKIAFTFF